jgi:hypothetical protein
MGRPSALNDAARAVIDAHPGYTPAALVKVLAAQGVSVHQDTIRRYRRARAAEAPAPARSLAARLEARAAAATAAADGELDTLTELRAVRQAALAALREWAPRLGLDRMATAAHARLLGSLQITERTIEELTPRPPEARYEAIEGAALEELLARAQAEAAKRPDLEAQLSRAMAMIEALP